MHFVQLGSSSKYCKNKNKNHYLYIKKKKKLYLRFAWGLQNNWPPWAVSLLGKWLQGKVLHVLCLIILGYPMFHHIGCFTLFLIFNNNVLLHSYVTLYWKRFSYITTRKVDAWTLSTVQLHCYKPIVVLAYGATIFMIYDHSYFWVPIVIAVLACVPITLFAFQHFHLWADTIRSTYWSRLLFRPFKHRLYNWIVESAEVLMETASIFRSFSLFLHMP